MKKLILLFIILTISGCGIVKKVEEKPVVETTKEVDEKIEETEESKEEIIEKTESDKIVVGRSSLKYGTYKGEFEDVKGLNATITINSDGTATYVGNVDSHGDRKNLNLTGTWKVKENAVQMSEYDKTNYDSILFTWNDGSEEGYAIGGSDYFGDQWHSFSYTK